ncbi:hypothetical protein ACFODZ_10065 [Marinicella sediminis]|uniref:MAPEG family protein n=1 Tax=Marinicella sediminis TaxID=1792834 RepID=A0ABV7J8Y4_9GAMM|nr:hypothetical protein [Marinicella sediminis]
MTVSLLQLWLPIVLAGVFCWIASALIHMVIKYHNADYKPLDNEDQVSDALRAGNPKPGLYTMPHCADMKDMNGEAMQDKFKQGPVAMISVFDNGMPPMGKLLLQQIMHFFIGALLVAYVACLVLTAGADYMSVFRLVMAVSFLAYGYGVIPFSIWYGHPWSNTARFLLDALIYAAVTAGTFAWLWPAAG